MGLPLRLPGDGSFQRLREESCMRSSLILRCVSAVCVTALFALFCAAPSLQAQGGEPQYFAIRGAKVVPVSGPPVENGDRSEEHTSELQSQSNLVCRLLLEKKKRLSWHE